jgi:Predicted amidophosphoribosyltransferases
LNAPVCLICGGDNQEMPTFRTFLSPSSPQRFCPACRTELAPIDPAHSCRLCGRDLSLLDGRFIRGSICTDCARWKEQGSGGAYQKNIALFTYNDFMKDLVIRFKFRGDAILADGFRKAFQEAFRKMSGGGAAGFLRRITSGSRQEPWLIVPIPLSPTRLNERGFNQAEILAGLTGKPVVPALIRTGNEQKQSKRNRRERLAQADNPFEWNQVCKTELKGKNILLIDDIYTTGATLRRAAAVLEPAGPHQIRSLTLAHG